METQNYLGLMDSINVIISFINRSLRDEGISCFKIRDLGEGLRFSLNKFSQDIDITDIAYVDDALRLIYDSLISVYPERLEVGATVELKRKQVTWNLAPVIDGKVMIEFISPKEKDQAWIHDEINKSCNAKGLV